MQADDEKNVRECMQNHIDGKTEFYQTIHRIRHKNNSYLWIMDRGKIVDFMADGSPRRFIGTHTDITQRKLMEERLSQAKDKAEFPC